MATRTYLIFKENNKEVLNCQIFGNNFYDSTFCNEAVKRVKPKNLTFEVHKLTSFRNALKQWGK